MPRVSPLHARLAVLLAFTGLLWAPSVVFAAEQLQVVGARLRLVPGGGPQAGYFSVLNRGPVSVRLIGASSPAFRHVMLHRSVLEDGTARMQALPEGVKVPAGGRIDFAPRGLHLMLMGPRQPLAVGQRIPVALKFAHGPSLIVQFAVVPLELD